MEQKWLVHKLKTLIKGDGELLKHDDDRQHDDDLYKSLFDNSPVGLYQTTPEGKILSANQALINMLNFDSLEDLCSRDISKGSYVNDSKRKYFISVLEQKGEIFNYESEWYTKDGKILYVREGARAVRDHEGKVCRYDGSVENITDLIKTQQALVKAKEKAEDSERLKTAFLANMSHEIRTPMNGVLGFLELLKDQDLTEEDKNHFIDIISKSGQQLLSTINSIIDLSKIDANQMPVHLEEVNLVAQLKGLYEFFEVECKEKGLGFYLLSGTEYEKIIFKTDRAKLSSILTNLIKNAIKYTDEGKITISYKLLDDNIEFAIKDTGIGISKEKQENVFKRFQQAEVELRRTYHGSGLGLAIAKAYAEMLNGKIWFKSTVGKGSVFYLSLPITEENKPITD